MIRPRSLQSWKSAVLGAFALLMFAAASGAQTNAAPATDDRVLLVLGDSLAAGYGLDPSQAFPALLQQEIRKEGLHFKVINAGLSGDTTAGGLRRLDWVLRQKVDVLLIELGGNDGLRGVPPETTRTNLQAMIERAKKKYPDIAIVIAGMKMPTTMGAEFRKQFEAVFPDVARANNALLIPFLLEGVGGIAELNLPDGIHPTAEGQKIVASNVWTVIRPVLKKLQTAPVATAAQ